MVAPLVMGAIGRQQQENGLDPQGLSQYLGDQQQQVQNADPGLMGALNSMLDSNRDGSVADDLSRIAGNFLSDSTPERLVKTSIEATSSKEERDA